MIYFNAKDLKMYQVIEELRDFQFPHYPFYYSSFSDECIQFFHIEDLKYGVSSYYTGCKVFMVLVLIDPQNDKPVRRVCDEACLLLSCLGYMCSFSFCTVDELEMRMEFLNTDVIIGSPGTRGILINAFPTVHYIEVLMNDVEYDVVYQELCNRLLKYMYYYYKPITNEKLQSLSDEITKELFLSPYLVSFNKQKKN